MGPTTINTLGPLNTVIEERADVMLPTSLTDTELELYLSLPLDQRAKMIQRLLDERQQKKVHTIEQCNTTVLDPYFLEN